jgi:hypothetical protein
MDKTHDRRFLGALGLLGFLGVQRQRAFWGR